MAYLYDEDANSDGPSSYGYVQDDSESLSCSYVEEDGGELSSSLNKSLGDSSKALPQFLIDEMMKKKQQEANAIARKNALEGYPSPLGPLIPSLAARRSSDLTGSWNERFQKLMDMDDSFLKYDLLRSTAHDFVHAAESYGRIIISERCVAPEKKTIPPKDIGGIAGGQKFIVQDILFKFAIDFEGIYGGDEGAMKGAGHDLNGLMTYLRAIELRPRSKRLLHVPLMSLIDYRGFRLVAICMLPIKRDTIVYGSFDAGRTVHYKSPECNLVMEEIGKFLNIKGHRCGQWPYLIYAPCDIEVHQGVTGDYYILDFARYMPPQPPSGKFGGALYELLRPELVARSPVPLSPDAFSAMGAASDGPEFRKAIKDVFQWLMTNVIVEYARLIDTEGTSSELTPDNVSLTNSNKEALRAAQEVLVREMHARGINMRFLGLVRSHCQSPQLKAFLLSECLARLWKCQLRHIWRDTMKSQTSPSEEPFRRVTGDFLNLILKSQQYEETLKASLESKFQGVLQEDEKSADFNLRLSYPNVYAFGILRLFNFLSVELEKGTVEALEACMESGTLLELFEFVPGDIVQMGCRTKHINIVDKADAYAHMFQASEIAKRKPEIAARLLSLALGKLLTAMKSSGMDMDLRQKFCLCRLEICKLNWILNRGNASDVAAAHEAMSALIIELENGGDKSLVPMVKGLLAKLFYYRAKYENVSHAREAISTTLSILDTLENDPKWADTTELVDFCITPCKAILLLRQRGELTQENDFPVIRKIVDIFMKCYEGDFLVEEKRGEVGFWLWYLLLSAAYLTEVDISSGSAVEVPYSIVEQMQKDANVFMAQALACKPALRRRFDKISSINDSFSLLEWIGAADVSQNIFDSFLSIVSSWSCFRVALPKHHKKKSIALASHLCFVRLLAPCSNLKILDLRILQRVSGVILTSLLSSDVRQSLEELHLPQCQDGYDSLLDLKDPFPCLKNLNARGTKIENAAIARVVELSPLLVQLDISMTNVSLEESNPHPLSSWLPEKISWLDLGFPESPWSRTELIDLIRRGKLYNLRFLGVAGTTVTEVEVLEALSFLPFLEGIDLFQCFYVSTLFVMEGGIGRVLKEAWLPHGHWYPYVIADEEVRYRFTHQPFASVTFEIRGRVAFTIKRNMSNVLHITPNPQTARDLHLEKLGDNMKLLPDVPLRTISRHGIRLSWTPVDLEMAFGELIVVAPVLGPGPKVGPRSIVMSIVVERKAYSITGMIGMNGKLSMVTFASDNLRFTMALPTSNNMMTPSFGCKIPAGVSMFVPFFALQALGINNSKEVDQLFIV